MSENSQTLRDRGKEVLQKLKSRDFQGLGDMIQNNLARGHPHNSLWTAAQTRASGQYRKRAQCFDEPASFVKALRCSARSLLKMILPSRSLQAVPASKTYISLFRSIGDDHTSTIYRKITQTFSQNGQKYQTCQRTVARSSGKNTNASSSAFMNVS